MDDAILHNEDMVGIGVQSGTAQECIELIQVLALEENDGWAVGRNVLASRVDAQRAYTKEHDQAADLLITRAKTHGEWNPFKAILAGGAVDRKQTRTGTFSNLFGDVHDR
jgi:hypothetical protein